jgi:hypothetical protein
MRHVEKSEGTDSKSKATKTWVGHFVPIVFGILI